MSTAVATIRPVRGIIPTRELLKETKNSLFDITRYLTDVVSKKSAEKLSDREAVEAVEAEVQEIKTEIEEKREENRFNDIRNKLIAKTLGISLKRLKNYCEDYKKFGDESFPSADENTLLEDGRRVALGQINANKNRKKELFIALISNLLTIVPVLCGVQLAVGIPIAFSIMTYLRSLLIEFKARIGNNADADEKLRGYIERLKVYMKKVEMLESKINEDQELIKKNETSMSKKEFKKWYGSYAEELKVFIEENFQVESKELKLGHDIENDFKTLLKEVFEIKADESQIEVPAGA